MRERACGCVGVWVWSSDSDQKGDRMCDDWKDRKIAEEKWMMERAVC